MTSIPIWFKQKILKHKHKPPLFQAKISKIFRSENFEKYKHLGKSKTYLGEIADHRHLYRRCSRRILIGRCCRCLVSGFEQGRRKRKTRTKRRRKKIKKETGDGYGKWVSWVKQVAHLSFIFFFWI